MSGTVWILEHGCGPDGDGIIGVFATEADGIEAAEKYPAPLSKWTREYDGGDWVDCDGGGRVGSGYWMSLTEYTVHGGGDHA